VREHWSDGFQCSSTPILHRSDFVLATGVGIAPTPPGLQPSVQTNYTIQWLVVPRGNAPRSSAYQAGALLLSYRTGKRIERRSGERLSMVCLVQERHVDHRAALGLGVHHHPMPERQRDRVMVTVTHRAASINARIT